jgi:hypothetical protein
MPSGSSFSWTGDASVAWSAGALSPANTQGGQHDQRKSDAHPLGSSIASSEDSDQAALIKALSGAKLTLLQGIAQVAKGTEVPIEAKYEMAHGKLMLSIYTSAKGFDCRPKAHRSVGAISRAAVDEQSEHSRDHPEGFGARYGPGC